MIHQTSKVKNKSFGFVYSLIHSRFSIRFRILWASKSKFFKPIVLRIVFAKFFLVRYEVKSPSVQVFTRIWREREYRKYAVQTKESKMKYKLITLKGSKSLYIIF